MKEPKLHTTERGTYYWERYPTRFWIRLPWVYRDIDEECGHATWEFEWRGLLARKWRRHKVWIVEKYNLSEIITTVEPSPLLARFSNNLTQTVHEWAKEEQPNK